MKSHNLTNAVLREAKCAKCGKVFLAAPEHIYRSRGHSKTKWYCSWTCFYHKDDKIERV